MSQNISERKDFMTFVPRRKYDVLKSKKIRDTFPPQVKTAHRSFLSWHLYITKNISDTIAFYNDYIYSFPRQVYRSIDKKCILQYNQSSILTSIYRKAG